MEQSTTTTTETTDSPKLSTCLEDNAGGISAMRILLLIWGSGVFLIWAIAAVYSTVGNPTHLITLPTIPSEVVTILLGITGAKAVQRFGEKA